MNPWVRWLKFNAVGGVGMVVQLAVLAVLKTGFGLEYLFATGLAVEAAVLHNFLWHGQFTWKDRPRKDRWWRLVKFNLSNGAISIVGNLVVMNVLVGLGINYLVANLGAIAGCSILNFVVSDWFVFEEL